MARNLSQKQQLFVQEYLVDLNATQAAKRAGYSEKTARQVGAENLTKPDIQQAISDSIQVRSQRTEVTQDYVLKTIVETIERSKQAQVITNSQGEPMTRETEDGELQVVARYDAGSVLKGAELLGKHLKMWTDKTELSGGMTLTHEDALEKLE